ncbi:MAG: hypothetical protein ACI8R4_003554, partial [Paracoccaceae bacterium]
MPVSFAPIPSVTPTADGHWEMTLLRPAQPVRRS